MRHGTANRAFRDGNVHTHVNDSCQTSLLRLCDGAFSARKLCVWSAARLLWLKMSVPAFLENSQIPFPGFCISPQSRSWKTNTRCVASWEMIDANVESSKTGPPPSLQDASRPVPSLVRPASPFILHLHPPGGSRRFPDCPRMRLCILSPQPFIDSAASRQILSVSLLDIKPLPSSHPLSMSSILI